MRKRKNEKNEIACAKMDDVCECGDKKIKEWGNFGGRVRIENCQNWNALIHDCPCAFVAIGFFFSLSSFFFLLYFLSLYIYTYG